MTLTWSKVKVTDFLNFRKLHFSTYVTSISSAILAWSSKLMVDYDNMGPSLRSQISEFLPSWRSRDFEVRKMLTSPDRDVRKSLASSFKEVSSL